ncbi:unnamed protein product [Anisakis simplex]|uniref:C2H2-type domain-containing protein n=1 Tax=Anisakis simplex TaxID=6269 RepID=A0A0M3K820_ANISI|nr:unnamed protein product [Anisakis simplex]
MEDYEQRKVGEKEMEGSLCDHMFPAQMRGAWVSSMLTLVMAMCIMPSPRAVGEYIERHWESLKKYCPPNLDKKYFVNEAKEVGNEDWEASPMLIEVICRLKNFQLMVHLIGTGGRSWMFGGRGPVRQAIKSSLGYAPLRFPQSERFAEKERWTTEAQQVTPVIVITPPTPPPVPRIIVTPPTPTASPPPQAPRYNLRSNTANVPVPNVPEERRTRSRPAPFRPANIEHLAPEYAIELAAPTTPAYEIINDKIYCRLENCARPGAPFETAAAWMTHVRRGKCHSNNSITMHGLRVPHPNALRPLLGPNTTTNAGSPPGEVPARVKEDHRGTPGRRVSSSGVGPGRNTFRPPDNWSGRRGGYVATLEAASPLRGGP